MATSRMEFDVSLSRGGARAREPGAPLRLLVLADLGGARSLPLAQRKPLAVDVDTFARVFTRIAPRLAIEVDELPLEVPFESLDDFHPDHLYDRLPPFAALRRLRGELGDPAHFGRAAAALGIDRSSVNPPSPATQPDAARASEAAADVERLLGRKPLPKSPAASNDAAPTLEDWLRRVVAPHVVPAVAHEQRALLAAADDALSALMRRVLHEPRWQALEATWRGVECLVRELELGEALELHLLDTTRAELDADIAAHQGDLAAGALHRLLNPGVAGEGRHWGLVVLDQAFGPGADDVRCLATLGALCARAGAPLLAAATPALVGSDNLATLAEPHRWRPADDPALAAWQALRTSPIGPWIGLALPRVLLRLPYGAATDRIERFAFEEMPVHEPAAYLWGSGALALALLAGRAWDADAGAFVTEAATELDDLPAHVVDHDGERRLQPVTERLLDDRTVEALVERGLMPLVARRDRPSARLWRWQSIAEPLQALRGLDG